MFLWLHRSRSALTPTVASWARDRLETVLAHYVHPASEDGRREKYCAVTAVGF